MSNIDNLHCNDPEESQCNICLQQKPVAKINDISRWRAFTKNILCNAKIFIALVFPQKRFI